MRTIAPGESLVYRFTATRAGIWMYHCSSMPMSAHIANGMFGAVVIDPPGLPPVDRSYVLVQSELYLGPQRGTVDVDRLRAEQPGRRGVQRLRQPVRPPAAHGAGRGAGPDLGARRRTQPGDARSTSSAASSTPCTPRAATGFGRMPARAAARALALAPSQGGFVELTFPEAGHYPFVSHSMVDAERGAHGIIAVTG